MFAKPTKPPLTSEKAITGIFKIAPADAKRIVARRPGKKTKH
jgi:hypothetical protein